VAGCCAAEEKFWTAIDTRITVSNIWRRPQMLVYVKCMAILVLIGPC